MARPEENNIVKAMKEAKTAREMVMSWGTQAMGRDMERSLKAFQLWVDRKPEMMEVFAQNILWRVIDRGILDGKTRSLVLLGITMAMGSKEGIVSQCANAKGAGCSEEEIMEIAYLACYMACKDKLAMTCDALTEAFRATANVKPRRQKT
jgi:alkylhydroperoxidase/carboxymuconolactone decarboxylase family protein YurZ